MARYIDADAIPWEGFPNDFGEYHEDYVEKRVVDKMPTIEARPVVRGKWEKRTDVFGFVRCSVCHDCNIYDDWADGNKWNFCPHCGADNRGDDNE